MNNLFISIFIFCGMFVISASAGITCGSFSPAAYFNSAPALRQTIPRSFPGNILLALPLLGGCTPKVLLRNGTLYQIYQYDSEGRVTSFTTQRSRYSLEVSNTTFNSYGLMTSAMDTNFEPHDRTFEAVYNNGQLVSLNITMEVSDREPPETYLYEYVYENSDTEALPIAEELTDFDGTFSQTKYSYLYDPSGAFLLQKNSTEVRRWNPQPFYLSATYTYQGDSLLNVDETLSNNDKQVYSKNMKFAYDHKGRINLVQVNSTQPGNTFSIQYNWQANADVILGFVYSARISTPFSFVY